MKKQHIFDLTSLIVIILLALIFTGCLTAKPYKPLIRNSGNPVVTTLYFSSNVPGAIILTPEQKHISDCPTSIKIEWKQKIIGGDINPYAPYGNETLFWERGQWRFKGIIYAPGYEPYYFNESAGHSRKSTSFTVNPHMLARGQSVRPTPQPQQQYYGDTPRNNNNNNNNPQHIVIEQKKDLMDSLNDSADFYLKGKAIADQIRIDRLLRKRR